jgi:DTW domain-containing protein
METKKSDLDGIKKCEKCWKVPSLCLCSEIQALTVHRQVLILQHPQESRNPFTTARLVSLSLPNTVHKVGLSWRSLSAALGKPTEPKNWAVLYVGTQKNFEVSADIPFQVLSPRREKLNPRSIQGIVLLDGNWKQSKTLWWRNPWLLKLNRIFIRPTEKSKFGKVRKEPRADCLSTLEATSETLTAMGEKVKEPLDRLLEKHIAKLLAYTAKK